MLLLILLTCNFILLSIVFYVNSMKTVVETKTIYISESEGVKKRIGDIDGIFEIHITVDHLDGFIPLINFVNNYEEGNIKVLFATSSENNNQYMISHFTIKTSAKDAVIKANRIAEHMKNKNIKVKRVKVEAMVSSSTKGIPFNSEEYNVLYSIFTTEGFLGKPYFEFHVKIKDNRSIESIKNICNIETDNVQSAVSWNLMSKNMIPLLTLRMYNMGLIEAQKNKDTILNSLKSFGYTFEDQIQEEFSIYDSNVGEDNGWII